MEALEKLLWELVTLTRESMESQNAKLDQILEAQKNTPQREEVKKIKPIQLHDIDYKETRKYRIIVTLAEKWKWAVETEYSLRNITSIHKEDGTENFDTREEAEEYLEKIKDNYKGRDPKIITVLT